MSDSPAPMATLVELAKQMAGDFSNQKQSFDDPKTFAHIRIFFRPLPFSFFNAVGFYSEQTYDYDLWTPYRQGVHKLLARDDGSVFIENYGLDDPVMYAGASRNAEIMGSIAKDCLVSRCGCAMVFRKQGDRFVGEVEPGRKCLIPRNGKTTYLVSEVELTETSWVSRDRGFDVDTDEHIWGSAAGPLKFEKRESFAHEVPSLEELLTPAAR
ncbi:MAG: chromophore lyase CpcT/CpeT [Cyanobacteria bacterium P01_F01_bin.153]